MPPSAGPRRRSPAAVNPWLDAFVPVFGLLALGALLRRRLLTDDAVWAGLERLVFWVLLPALLVSAIAAVDLGRLPVGRLAPAIWGALLAGAGLALALAAATGQAHPAATSVLQGGIRFNNLVGFALVGAVAGPGGLALGGVVTGLIVPFVQVLVTLAFALGDGAARRPTVVGLARQLLRNPLLLACAAGFAVSALGGLPPGLGAFARGLGAASLALGLLCCGAALSAAGLRDRLGLQAVTAALKLGLMPLLTLGLGRLCGLEGAPLAVATLFMALPTATTSYVMARVMGGDARLVAAMITGQHLLAALTLPAWALVLAEVAAGGP